jgi:AsmA family protein
MNWRRVALGSVAGAAIVAVAASLVARVLADPERLKRIARDKAMAAWSRELVVGDMRLDLFPVPALHATGIALANPPWARDRSLLTAGDVVAHLALLPLLSGEVRVKSIALEHVSLDLESAPGGATSWNVSPGPRAAAKPEALADLTGLEIRDATIMQRTPGKTPVPWQLESLDASAERGLRDVRVEAKAARRGHAVEVKARFADLSRRGEAGSATDGRIDLDWGTTHVAIEGRIPLDGTLAGHAVHADLESSQLNDLLAFFDIARRPTAAAQVHLDSRDANGAFEVKSLALSLGAFRVQGEARVRNEGGKTMVDARLSGGRLDWVRTLLDAGAEPVARPAPPEMFLSTPFAWALLVALDGVRGSVDAKLQSVRLRNGVELRDVATRSTFDGDRWDMASFSVGMLGGTATGSMRLEGKRQAVHMHFDGQGLLLERWFRERGTAIAFHGGPMAVKADVDGAGPSMRDLAASLTGPVTIRLVRGALANEKAGAWEAKLVGAKEEGQSGVEFECVAANLPFRAGRAERSPLIAARSDISYLVTEGFVDLRDESLQLRGRVKPLHAGGLGMSAIAGDVLISGPIRQPHIEHDPSKTPVAVARVGAAIATLGLSAVATASADASQARQNDPCAAVF